MKITRNWLKQYVDFDGSADDLAERLTLLGLEVEDVRKTGGEFEGVVVAQILSTSRHPNADKLSVCRVHDGKGERQIVCGASNYKVGDKVPLILPGATLPAQAGAQPLTIRVGKIRGLESQGMMCSPQELGLGSDTDGLLILPPDAKVGQPFAEHLGRPAGDACYDIEVTPNRPDLNSLIGIAREIAAVTGKALRIPEVQGPEFNTQSPPPKVGSLDAAFGSAQAALDGPATAARVHDLVAVRVEDPALCPRYTARVVRGVRIGPSPDWLRATLENVGLRSINNVVDVTNYVMLEIGQPLHAFDYRQVASGADGRPTIVVRRARDRESFVTLDGARHILANERLLIADEEKAIALAGVMGGRNTEINEHTVDVLIESAYFDPANIRRTSKTLGLRTDASYRFERGADIGICDWASRRCARLILQTAGGRLAEGVVDAYPNPVEPRHITLRPAKVNQLLGIHLRPEEIEGYLGQLGLAATARVPRPVEETAAAALRPITIRIPTFRVDLKREVDLIEEVARLHGVDQIPSTPPRGATGANAYDAVHHQLAEARRLLTSLGLDETQGQTLVSHAECGTQAPECVKLANPLSADMDALRPSLLPGLLHSLRHNASRRNHDAAIFELGRVFLPGPTPREQRRIALALTGRRHPWFWSGADRDAVFDLFDAKGLLEEFVERFGLRGLTWTRRAEESPLWAESALIQLGGKLTLGELGQLRPALARQYQLRDAVFLAECDLDELLARRNPAKSFRPLPAFPSIRRDVAMVVPEATTHEAILRVVRQAKPRNLEHVELFDVYRGKGIPPGQKSLAYAFTYQHAERTLTDAEVNEAHAQLVAAFKQRLQATVRE